MAHEVLDGYACSLPSALAKEIDHLDQYCQQFLALCPFVVLSSATLDGTPEVTPRGGEPGFCRVIDPTTLLLPDRAGNNRLDSLRKIAMNPSVALLCMVPGIDETLRIYGRADLCRAGDVPIDTTERGREARSVLVIHVERAFMHCAKALMRSRLWDPDARVKREVFPRASEIFAAHAGTEDSGESQDDMARRYSTTL